MSTQSLERSPAEVVPMDDDQLLPLGDSILASWIRSICQTVRGYGVSPEAIFERIGMDPTLLTVPDARYPAMTVRRFWEAVISATGDELIGLTCGQEMQAPTLHRAWTSHYDEPFTRTGSRTHCELWKGHFYNDGYEPCTQCKQFILITEDVARQ